jgi:hypothetical protein
MSLKLEAGFRSLGLISGACAGASANAAISP